MTTRGHLWAVGYDSVASADQLRTEIARLAANHCFEVLESAVAVRYPDGSFTLDGEPFIAVAGVERGPLARFLAALALCSPPLTGAAVGLMQSSVGSVSALGIDEDFVCQVECLMKPGTSALFVLDRVGDLGTILAGIRGLGGTVLKTNVDLDRAKLIQSTLAAASASPIRESPTGPRS